MNGQRCTINYEQDLSFFQIPPSIEDPKVYGPISSALLELGPALVSHLDNWLSRYETKL